MPNHTLASVYHQDRSGFAEVNNATYDEIAQYLAGHPEIDRLRVIGEYIPSGLPAEEFLERYQEGE